MSERFSDEVLQRARQAYQPAYARAVFSEPTTTPTSVSERAGLAAMRAVLEGHLTEQCEGVTVHASAAAGMTEAMGGKSGATVVHLTWHEVGDIEASGQAFTLDGRFNIRDDGGLLREQRHHAVCPQAWSCKCPEGWPQP
jgi:hypothetical protein